jgi:hypothetical protein
VTYQNDAFYDPVLREHRRVAFGFLSFSLPHSDDSSRAWRIAWDNVFFGMVMAVGGHLRFDLRMYQSLDPASRRLFLLLSKLFCRHSVTPKFDLVYLGVEVLGFAPSIAPRDLRIKIKRCVQRLIDRRIVAPTQADAMFRRSAKGACMVRLERGEYFRNRSQGVQRAAMVESPLIELLREIGLDDQSASRCIRKHPRHLVQQWVDITLAAKERHGASFFKRSPAAYFVDNLQKAAQGTRTPPDWWHALRREERRPTRNVVRSKTSSNPEVNSYDALVQDVFGHFERAGQPSDIARRNAVRFAESCQIGPKAANVAQLLKLFR